MRLYTIALLLIACRDNKTEGTQGSIQESIDADADGFDSTEDCDDNDAQIYPDAVEECDGIDNDCDGSIDEEVLSTFYADSDGDGYGNPDIMSESCEMPDGFASNGSDCDDTEALKYPGATEECDGLDNDCNDLIDDGLSEIYYEDLDGDGFGSAVEVESCGISEGVSSISGDCNDADDAINPVSEEDCDGIDNNCDGSIDEDVLITYYLDFDEDGFGDNTQTQEGCEAPEDYVIQGEDCNDLDSLIYPNAVEYCDDQDNNCDGNIDEGEAIGALLWYEDGDADGYGDSASTLFACNQPSGYVGNELDCDDNNNTISPDASELCDTIDNNCDGSIDEDGASDAPLWYFDADQDGFGGSAATLLSCTEPTGYTSNSDDCDDFDNDIHPDAEELCDGEDNNCDGNTDDNSATNTSTFYLDEDGDGYGDAAVTEEACNPSIGYTDNDEDCDDDNDSVSPSANELCDSIDNNCNNVIDEDSAIDAPTWYIDDDRDGYGDASSTMISCDVPNGYTDSDTDCDDNDEFTHPGAAEFETSLSIVAITGDDVRTCSSLGYRELTQTECEDYALSAGKTFEVNNGAPAAESGCMEWDHVPGNVEFMTNTQEDTCKTGSTCYCYEEVSDCMTDADQDGYGDATPASTDVAAGEDCDDSDPDIAPEALDICDSVDNNCDGNIDEDCTGSSCKDIAENGIATTDGFYTIDPMGTGSFEAYCDMTTEGGGWTRVSVIPLASSSCVFDAGAMDDPASATSCAKYSDAMINAIAQEKVFYSDVPGYDHTFTKYDGSIAIDAQPGQVVQGGSYADVANETPNYTISYGAWFYFHQENWYASDTCLGSPANTARLSLEYSGPTYGGGFLYACANSCSAQCSTRIQGVTADVYIK
ncbi:MAG: MopE-related protein [Myxococcota bacterium]|nr:MopE-related protein [Myxococcota bacterium]